MITDEALLPCPFCGLVLNEDGDEWHHTLADCPLSDCVFDERQIAEWNTRQQAQPLHADEVERVAQAIATKCYAVIDGNEDCADWFEMSERAREVYREAGRAAIAALSSSSGDRLREVLKFYADPENWHGIYMVGNGPMSDDWGGEPEHPDYPDGKPGKRARTALESPTDKGGGADVSTS